MKSFLFSCFMILSLTSIHAQQRWWSFTNKGWTACKTVELPDNTYLSVGDIDKRLGGEKKPYNRGINIIRYDLNGEIKDSSYINLNLSDTFHFRGTETSYRYAVQLIGNYIYIGINEIDSNDYYPDYLLRFAWDAKHDSSGFIHPEVLTKIQSGTYLTNIYSVMKDTFNRYLVLSLYQNSSNRYVFYTSLTCFDSSFHQLWKRDFKMGLYDDLYPEQLVEDGRGGYLLVCQRQIYYRDIDPNIYQQYVFRLDSAGNTLWALPFTNDSFSLYNMRIAPLGNDSFAAFYTDNDINGNLYMSPYLQQANYHSTLIACPFSLEGKKGEEHYLNQFIQWKLGLEFNGNNSDISWDEEHNIYVLGSYYHASDYGYLIKFRPDLTPVWFRRYDILPQSHPNQDDRVSNFPYTLTRTSDKGFLLTGEYWSTPSAQFPSGTQQGMVIKVDSLGCLEGGCGIKDGIEANESPSLKIEVYPNPANDLLYIRYSGTQFPLLLNLYDLMGRKIKEMTLSNTNGNAEITTKDMQPGLYLLELLQDGKVISTRKQVISR